VKIDSGKKSVTSKKLFKTSMLLTCTLGAMAWYANQPGIVNIGSRQLRKASELEMLKVRADSVFVKPQAVDTAVVTKAATYGTKRRFLLLGDSQVEGLKNQLYDYSVANGHELLCAVTWYSASDRVFATHDTIADIIRHFQPDYILFAIGLNQLYQKDMSESEKSVKKLVAMFDTIPYCWIGPANFTTDKGINELYQKMIPEDRLFLSKDLVLSRANDRRHPSTEGYRVWMDSIGRWLEKKSRWPIEMKRPDTVIKKRAIKNIIFSVVE
jgi:hypothetical protein